jgi:predicted unusual protein kinase regulating ubiquinone biosynthesis (AarF/ABC1/UbiB family)
VIPGFYLLVKAMVTMEGIGYKLDPDFMMEHLEPFAETGSGAVWFCKSGP